MRLRYTAVPILLIGFHVQPSAALTCVGDCGGVGFVEIADLIVGVDIVLGQAPVSACTAFENAYGVVDIAQLIQGVENALDGCPGSSNTAPLRMRYVRTDAATPYWAIENPSWIVYNAPTGRFFVADPFSNSINVLNAASETVVGTIHVPGAYGMDDTPDHLTLYVGTLIGDVYTLDPMNLRVTRRYAAAGIGPEGFYAAVVRVMADGRLALLEVFDGRPSSLDGSPAFAIWNPVDNSLSTYPGGRIATFTRTPDRKKIVLAGAAGQAGLSIFDEATATIHESGVVNGGFIFHIAVTPDRVLVPSDDGQMVVLDLDTLTQIGVFNVAGDPSPEGALFVSPDSKTLYMSSASIIYAYDVATGEQIGWLPNFFVLPGATGLVSGPLSGPNIQAIADTGLLAGPMAEGVGFIDTTALRSGAVGTQFTYSFLNPATGPVGGGTPATWSYPALAPTVTSVYVGSRTATDVTESSNTLSFAKLSLTTPPGASGPADVYAMASDGGIQILPEGFSYGPSVLEITPNAATAAGGSGVIYGYGLGDRIEVRVGGRPTSVTGFVSNAYGIGGPPFPLQALTYAIPPGTAGTADVTVTTSFGSVTVPNGMTYLSASVQQYPLSGSTLVQGIYDRHRDVYYFTDTQSVRVFSKTLRRWLRSISIPPAGASERLWGLALSPDGSKLAIADATAESVYVLNPDTPAAIKTVSVPPDVVIREPVGVAISDAGVAYVATFAPAYEGSSGFANFLKLDTNTGALAADYRRQISSGGSLTDKYLRTIISADNSRVFFNNDGEFLVIDTATDDVNVLEADNHDDDLALSGDQSRVAGDGHLYDSNLNAESNMVLNLREQNISYLYGQKLSADGRLLFQPTDQGIDVYDGRLGSLLSRIALPLPLSPNYDALVSDGQDNVLVAITGNADGVSVIDLSAFEEPPALPYPAEMGSPSCAATGTIAPSTPVPRFVAVHGVQHVTTEMW